MCASNPSSNLLIAIKKCFPAARFALLVQIVQAVPNVQIVPKVAGTAVLPGDRCGFAQLSKHG
jgi:hypothetical protein